MIRLGIDVAKATLQAHVCHDTHKASHRFLNTPAGFTALAAWLDHLGLPLGEVRVCLEATGGYEEAVATYLASAHKLHAWTPVPPAYRDLQKLVRLRDALKDDRTAWENRGARRDSRRRSWPSAPRWCRS